MIYMILSRCVIEQVFLCRNTNQLKVLVKLCMRKKYIYIQFYYVKNIKNMKCFKSQFVRKFQFSMPKHICNILDLVPKNVHTLFLQHSVPQAHNSILVAAMSVVYYRKTHYSTLGQCAPP